VDVVVDDAAHCGIGGCRRTNFWVTVGALEASDDFLELVTIRSPSGALMIVSQPIGGVVVIIGEGPASPGRTGVACSGLFIEGRGATESRTSQGL